MEETTKHEEHAASENSFTPSNEKLQETGDGKAEHLEAIRTVSRVPNPRYYEKDGLRTYGDDEDHDHEPPVSPPRAIVSVTALMCNQMTIHRLMSLIAMAFLWTGSQIPVYLFGL